MTGFEPDSNLVAATRPSPNHGPRRAKEPSAIILHYTGMATAAAALARLCDPISEVSAHYVVAEDGVILQLVPEARRAWHAGHSYWAGERDMNSASIGIELVNGGHELGAPAYPKEQIDALIALCHDIATRHAISPRRILAHSDIAPGRKIDPGEYFPWMRLADSGVGHYTTPHRIEAGPTLAPGAAGADVVMLQAMLDSYGYQVPMHGTFDPATAIAVAAFQRHFRPALVDGIGDRSTLATLRALESGA